MRLENLSSLPYDREHKVRKFGNWAVSDFDIVSKEGSVGTFLRRFSYYGTTMLDLRWNWGKWEVAETYIGWGSASEQKGVNRILAGANINDTYYRRNGGNPRYEVKA